MLWHIKWHRRTQWTQARWTQACSRVPLAQGSTRPTTPRHANSTGRAAARPVPSSRACVCMGIGVSGRQTCATLLRQAAKLQEGRTAPHSYTAIYWICMCTSTSMSNLMLLGAGRTHLQGTDARHAVYDLHARPGPDVILQMPLPFCDSKQHTQRNECTQNSWRGCRWCGVWAAGVHSYGRGLALEGHRGRGVDLLATASGIGCGWQAG